VWFPVGFIGPRGPGLEPDGQLGGLDSNRGQADVFTNQPRRGEEGPVDVEQHSELPQLYARGITACRSRDTVALGRVVVELIGRLNFDYDVAARRLGRVYVLAMEDAQQGRFRQSLRIFRSLHTAAAPRDSSVEPAPSMKDVRGSIEST
jgi:hypothetical protein